MMTGAGLKKGDPGYEDSDQAFYDKYMNLYERTGDQAHKDTAETAWRNKQTSDRLAAYTTGFEDYCTRQIQWPRVKVRNIYWRRSMKTKDRIRNYSFQVLSIMG